MSDDDRYRRFNLRIPKDTFARLQEAADARSHSMNAEIIHRLEESFTPSSLEEIMDAHAVPPQDLNYAKVNVILAQESLEHAQELAQSAEEDENIDPVDKAIARYQVKRARKHLDRSLEHLGAMQKLFGK